MKKAGHAQKENNTAQTMIELAVFGAVLFFVIGGIALNYISGAFQQDSQLQSARRALLSSYVASKKGSGSRATGSFSVYQDRLTGDFGKYGALDRQPIVAAGSGMMTAQAMQVNDWGDPDSVPVMDVTVNGESFVFRTGIFVTYVIALKGSTVQIIALKPLPIADLKEMAARLTRPQRNIQVNALLKASVETCLGGGEAMDPAIDCNVGTYIDPVTHQRTPGEQLIRLAREWTDMPKDGMPPFFTGVAANDPEFKTIPNNNTALAFNFKRTGNAADAFPYPALTPVWRWTWKYFWEPKKGDTDWLKKQNILQKIIDKESPSFSYDVDGDLREEALYDVEDVTTAFCTGSCQNAYKVDVQDPKLADIDPGKGPLDFSDPDQKPGMRPDLKIYGSTSCVATADNPCTGETATYLDVKEGKLYSNGAPVAVSTLQKNQYDVIERAYQLNVNMIDTEGFLANNNIEGRKVAGGCGGASFKDTCFDSDTKTLHIRSRLSDQRGHKWITDTNRTWGSSL